MPETTVQNNTPSEESNEEKGFIAMLKSKLYAFIDLFRPNKTEMTEVRMAQASGLST